MRIFKCLFISLRRFGFYFVGNKVLFEYGEWLDMGCKKE